MQVPVLPAAHGGPESRASGDEPNSWPGRESRQFPQSTLDALAFQVAVLDQNGTLVAANAGWREFSRENAGTAVAGEIGDRYLDLLDPSPDACVHLFPEISSAIREVLTGQRQQSSAEYPVHLANGEHWYLLRAARFLESGAVRVVLSHDDITDRKGAAQELQHAKDELENRVRERTLEVTQVNAQLYDELVRRNQTEAELTEARQMLQLVMNHIPQAIFWKDRDSVYLGCNDRLAADAGFSSPEELIGRSDLELPWAKHAPAYLADDRQVIETGTPKLNIEEPMVRADGQTAWLRTGKIPLRDAIGNVVGVLCSYEDVTEQKRAEAVMNDARQVAEAANLAKSEFLSRMSHELRTPLNAILGFGQILELENLTEQAQESLGFILKGGRHLLGLINEVLDIAKVEAGHIEFSLEPVALGDIVPEACSLMRPLAQARGIRLLDNAAEIGRAHVVADQQRLKQVLINLVANAIKYNRDDGQVEIVCTQTEEGLTAITVEDSGLGIAPEDMAKLFVPFERLGARESAIEGTGLGLVLSQRLVTAMGGTLTAESTLGVGSSFTVTLPATASPLERAGQLPQDTHQSSEPGDRAGNYCVLCIEDNPSNLSLVERVFQARPEVRLLTAMQGSVGLDLARQYEPDLILLDLNLPDVHGSEILKRLRQSALTRDIPVVVVSADATPVQIDRLMAGGAQAYLTKPLNIRDFLQTVDLLLRAPDPTSAAAD